VPKLVMKNRGFAGLGQGSGSGDWWAREERGKRVTQERLLNNRDLRIGEERGKGVDQERGNGGSAGTLGSFTVAAPARISNSQKTRPKVGA